MIISFEDIGNYEFSISDINLIHQKPIYRHLAVKKRHCNGFLFFIKGECVYEYENEKLTFSPGSAVYLPLGSQHTLKVVSEDIEFFRIDFTIKVDNQVVLFSNHPINILPHFNEDCIEIIDQLKNLCLYSTDNMLKMEKLLNIFCYIKNKSRPVNKSKLFPASVYIAEHFTQQINCEELAKLCFLSTSQFYNLFNKQFGCTPLQYRDRLLLQRAKTLLKLEEINVSEISEMLGFNDVAYFSRFFKKRTGINPSEYRDQRK